MTLARNLFGVLDRSARSHYADRPAFGFEGELVTFREMRDRSLDVAAGLSAAGVRPGDRVAVMMGNRLEWVEVLFGLAALGAVCVPVNVLLTGPEIDHMCRDSEARFMIADEIAQAGLADIDHDFELLITVDDIDPGPRGAERYETVRKGGAWPPPDHREPDLGDTLILYYSSGTTGLPKAAVHTHDSVLWNSFGQLPGLGLTPDVRYGVIASFSWAAGFHNLVLALAWIGGFSQIRRTGSASMESVTDFIVDHGITHIMLVPSLLRDLVTRPDLMARLSASPLVWVITGTEPVPRAVIEKCQAEMPGVAVCQGFGLSEFPTITTVLRPEEVAAHEGSAGRAMPHADTAVRDADGEIRFSGRGELLLRSPASMKGYHNRPEQTAEAFRDGWLHTGDLVELDEDGYITVVGRTKDMIISGGLNVYPQEIEDLVVRLPGVTEVAVVGVPHERFGETPVAVVVTSDPDFDPASVAAACEGRLASYKRPRWTLVRSEPLPRNANAKVLKREIRPWAATQLSIAIED
ncbi:class I adenylate-forming enzyme family protein [Nocardioides sp. LHD-245]|uniref:class I adenylate-forming enzyme family protein n=1 Tax=Nocardioides sp. LHD-245 TaxID=3051387 RepID=UPI0027E06902|nr:class I adenylate-forming enzyme family protein [Nocardioides sp. LHD-245]